MGKWREALTRLAAPEAQREAWDLQRDVAARGATAVRSCHAGAVVTVSGEIRALRLTPVGSAPSLELDLYDGSATLRVVFLGRRTLAGLQPGRLLTVSGRVAERQGQHVMYNPRYELLEAGR